MFCVGFLCWTSAHHGSLNKMLGVVHDLSHILKSTNCFSGNMKSPLSDFVYTNVNDLASLKCNSLIYESLNL